MGTPVTPTPTFPDFIQTRDGKYHPGEQGDTVNTLMCVTRGGRRTLIGSVTDAGSAIVDLVSGDVLFDFYTLGLGPLLYADPYCAFCQWNGKYYFGGLINGNHPIGSSPNFVGKYSVVLEASSELNTWRTILLDGQGQSATYAGEITDLIPTNDALYICRGDGSVNNGLYKYNGSVITSVDLGHQAFKGTVFMDELQIALIGSTSILRVRPLAADALSTISFGSITARTGGTYAVDATLKGATGVLGTMPIFGTLNGYIIGDPVNDNANVRMIPLFTRLIDAAGFSRCVGWRSQFKQVAGGVVVGVNAADPPNGGDTLPGYLVYISAGGKVKCLATGGHIGTIEVFNGRLYYGNSPSYHSTQFSMMRNNEPGLYSIDIADIHNARPCEIREQINFSTNYVPGTSGVNGFCGGWPTLGMRTGAIVIGAGTGGNFQIYSYPAAKSSVPAIAALTKRPLGSAVAITGAAAPVVIDLTPYLNQGELIGFDYSATSTLYGNVYLTP